MTRFYQTEELKQDAFMGMMAHGECGKINVFQQFFNELFLFLGICFTQCISRSDITESQTLEKIEQSSGTERYSESLFHKCACGGAVQLAKIPTPAFCGVFVEITVRSCVSCASESFLYFFKYSRKESEKLRQDLSGERLINKILYPKKILCLIAFYEILISKP